MTCKLIDELIDRDRKNPKKIFVIGDPMTDVYISGYLTDCQDGCQKFVEERRVEVDGGAANARASLKNWNAKIELSHDRRYGCVKTRFMVDNKCVMRYDNDKIDMDLSVVRSVCMWKINEWYPDAVLLSDYDKGLLTPDFLRKIIDRCKELHIPCIVDAKREPELYKGALIKCNCAYLRKYCGSFTEPIMVVTYGSNPPGITTDLNSIKLLNTMELVECKNHIGAGDCFAAHLTLGLAYGFSLKESVEIAHSAGRVYVQHLYNRPPTPSEIKEDLAKIL